MRIIERLDKTVIKVFHGGGPLHPKTSNARLDEVVVNVGSVSEINDTPGSGAVHSGPARRTENQVGKKSGQKRHVSDKYHADGHHQQHRQGGTCNLHHRAFEAVSR